MADNSSEIPQSMHELAEQKLKQAQAAYDQITAHATNAMNAWIGAIPSNPMTASLKDAQDRAIENAKRNTEAAFAVAGKIAHAKTPQEVITFQTQFAQDLMQAFVKQGQNSADRSHQKP